MGAFFIATWWRQLIQGTNVYCERIYRYNQISIEMRIMYIMLNMVRERGFGPTKISDRICGMRLIYATLDFLPANS